MSSQQNVMMFRSITQDQLSTDQDIHKYLKWGNNNMQKALNYYYHNQEKIKNQHQQSSPPLFDLMKKASVKQQQTATFIAQVRKQYQLPITSNTTQPTNQMDQEYQDADYLPKVFNTSFDQNHQEVIIQPSSIIKSQPIIKKQNQQISLPKNLSHSTHSLTQHCSINQFADSQLYLGEIIIKCIATQSKNMHQCQPGTPIALLPFIQNPSKKKSIKKELIILNIRVSHEGRIFGRVDDEEARILVPLIHNQLIRIQSQIFDTPLLITFPNTFRLRTQVFLLKKAITQPIIETYQGTEDVIVKMYKEVRQQLLGLFYRLNLKIITQPLIKGKSMYHPKNQLQPQQRKSQQQGNTQLLVQRQNLNEKRQQQELRRKRNDPNYKMVQMNITQIFQSQKKEHSEKKQQQKHSKDIQKRVIELNFKDQSKFSQLIDLYHQDLQPANTSTYFTSQLYHYQQLALAWMLKRQGQAQDQSLEKQDIHPLWTEYQLTQSKYRLFFNQLTAQISLKRPISKIRCRGGILADQMGLGKTVMMSALISMKKAGISKAKQGHNLIVLPLTLLYQWESELNKHTKSLKVLQYYGSDRHKNSLNLNQYDVILTTYGTISYEFSKGNHISLTGLYRYKWKRIILDEAHYIKGRIIQTAKAVYQLDADCRWCLTGTPLQNNLSDLFSLIHFIRYTPWADYQCWTRYIQKPYENGETGVLQVLRTLLKRVFLRRTKNSRDQNGKLIVQLPNKISKVEILTMSPKERQFYDGVYQASKRKIDELNELKVVQARYMQVLQILMRLRQICCHPALFQSITKFVKDPKDFEAQLRKFIKKRQSMNEQSKQQQNYYQPIVEQNQDEIKLVKVTNQEISEEFIKETINKIVSDDIEPCKICLNDVEYPVITSCLHIFCKSCLIRQIQENMSCGYCRKKISKQDYLHLPRQNRLNIKTDKDFFRSTKMQAIISILNSFEPEEKVVIFSQFLGMLDLIQSDLVKHKILFTRMEGSHSQKQRTKAINSFQNDPQIRVFLVSLKTAGVGLNLVAANKVILADPWWNPGVEQQAIERVHRIGQKKQVEIIRLIMDETIEMRMLELNANKRNLSQAVMAHQPNQSRIQTLKYLMQKY